MSDYFDVKNKLQIKSENFNWIKNNNDIKRQTPFAPRCIFRYYVPDSSSPPSKSTTLYMHSSKGMQRMQRKVTKNENFSWINNDNDVKRQPPLRDTLRY